MKEHLPFDRDFPLMEALASVPKPKLEKALTGVLGDRWQVVDADRAPVLQSALPESASVISVPLRQDFETVGELRASDTPKTQVESAARWLELVMHASLRYQMASDLHIQSMQANYDALRQKHEALQQSESRYRQLAEQLEQRVQAQVAEIELKQRRLYLAEKMASIGSLAAGMAHEINNPVGFIRSNLHTAKGYVRDLIDLLGLVPEHGADAFREKSRQLDLDFVLADFNVLLEESKSGADRIAAIVTHLKAFSNVDRESDKDVDLNHVIQAVLNLAYDQLAAAIELKADLQALPSVDCDRAGMGQVLFSLIQNALLAVAEKGGIVRVASKYCGNEIQIQVSDNGCGIKPDILPRIFDPFFTTRAVGEGTGLGLTVSRDIVGAHAGTIDVHSEPGNGSTFTIRLPYVDKHPDVQQGGGR
jgi:two-component system NtrC family sensor kinase